MCHMYHLSWSSTSVFFRFVLKIYKFVTFKAGETRSNKRCFEIVRNVMNEERAEMQVDNLTSLSFHAIFNYAD